MHEQRVKDSTVESNNSARASCFFKVSFDVQTLTCEVEIGLVICGQDSCEGGLPLVTSYQSQSDPNL
eukprot:5419595-Amphidinium_carterae.1